MKYVWAMAALLALLFSLPSLQAVEKQYRSGRIIRLEKKARERVLYYLVNTPVTHDDPYYEVSLQTSEWIYLAEYTPRHDADSLPQDWKPGTEVQLKLAGKRHLLAKAP